MSNLVGLDAWIMNVPEHDHYPECEDRKYWHCPDCGTLYKDSDLNWCCYKFIPRVNTCVCDDMVDIH